MATAILEAPLLTEAVNAINLDTEIAKDTAPFSDVQDIPDLDELAWSHCKESSKNLISDFYTKPTLPMLAAIISTTLGDGDNDEDVTTNALQEYVAGLLGHEGAILVPTGTMGNQMALRTALGSPPHSILVDYRGHIVNFEGGGPTATCSTLVRTVVPANGHHLTLEDVKKFATIGENMYVCPTRVIALENPMEGRIVALEDIQAISKWARAQDPPIHMHLDGARLWEAVAAGACTLREIGECFDSIQMCFTKGLGAPLGSIVVGKKTFIHRAKWARKMLGGGMRSTGVIAAPARIAIDDVLFGGKLKAGQERAVRAAKVWTDLGGKLLQEVETNMVWLDFPGSGLDPEAAMDEAKKFDLTVGGAIPNRLVFHYQVSEATLGRVCDWFRALLPSQK